MKDDIYFVTTNDRKFKECEKYITKTGASLIQHSSELIEPQTTDSFAIVQHKLDQARRILPNKKVLVDDRSFVLPAINGFPGPMLKLVLNTAGIKGLLKLMHGVDNREALFVTSLGYFDGRDEHIIQTREKGFLTTAEQGNNLRGWTNLLYIYGHESYPDKSLAQLDDTEWDNYLKIVTRDDAFALLRPIIEAAV